MALVGFITAASAFWATYRFGFRYRGFIYNTILCAGVLVVMIVAGVLIGAALASDYQQHSKIAASVWGYAIIGCLCGIIYKWRMVRKNRQG